MVRGVGRFVLFQGVVEKSKKAKKEEKGANDGADDIYAEVSERNTRASLDEDEKCKRATTKLTVILNILAGFTRLHNLA